jgi:hypothetical protein
VKFVRLCRAVVKLQAFMRGHLDRNRLQDELNEAMLQDECDRLVKVRSREANSSAALSPTRSDSVSSPVAVVGGPVSGVAEDADGKGKAFDGLLKVLDVDMVIDVSEVYTAGWTASVLSLEVVNPRQRSYKRS